MLQETNLHGTDHVFESHKIIGHNHSKEDGHDPGADESLNCLLGGDLDELCSSKRDSADISKDVIGDDQ